MEDLLNKPANISNQEGGILRKEGLGRASKMEGRERDYGEGWILGRYSTYIYTI